MTFVAAIAVGVVLTLINHSLCQTLGMVGDVAGPRDSSAHDSPGVL
jgi:hypothetical protein